LGDHIQFVRFLPQVKARGGRVVFECPPELEALFGNHLPGMDILLPRPPNLSVPDVECDVQISVMDLARYCRCDLETIPAPIPYVTAPEEKVVVWKDRLAADGPAFRVGLVWAGNRSYSNDANRSVRLADFAPLAAISCVHYYALQKGEAAEQADTPPAGMTLTRLDQEIQDFTDTAAAIMNLDLVIAVDTSVAHLAGALGRPVWTLIPNDSDWRWLLDREDTPWYPTMRLFRQTTHGDWSSVLSTVAVALRQCV
jgi:hypothetical protein